MKDECSFQPVCKLFANKKGRLLRPFLFADYQVPGTGIEPAHPCERQILSLLRLPIPPPGLESSKLKSLMFEAVSMIRN